MFTTSNQKSCYPLETNETCNKHVNIIIAEEENDVKHEELVNHVQRLMAKVKDDRFEDLIMVDSLQRLAIDYHFEDEINLILRRRYTQFLNTDLFEHQNLYEVSLCFRILRQKGFQVSPDVFANFKQKDGKFKGEIAEDVKGLMALYEASQLSIEGEGILEDAAHFSRHCLEETMPFLDEDEAIMVKNTLVHSYQRTPSSFMVKRFIQHYMGTTMSQLADLELAKLQLVHQTEVDQISRWWKELGLAQELKLARNQPLNWYLWPMASLTDPTLSDQRIELTKTIALIFLIDDIFDVYGTLDQLILFTEAVNRWDINTLERLPYHLRICIQALYDEIKETSDKIYNKYGFNPMEYLKRTWAKLCEAFLVEAKWFASGQLPMAEDYLKNGIVSSGAHVVTMHMFFLLGGATSKEIASIIDDNPSITYCLAKILRLWDDLGSAKDEKQDGHDGSYVMYYMTENEGCTIEEAQEHVMAMISNTWKQLNKECLLPNQFSATFTKACLNLARMVPLMYNYDDNHSLPHVKDFVSSMF
nr:terpene synthase [Atractylodes lancea]